MSVAFEIEVTRSRRVRCLCALTWAVPAAGLISAAVQFASGPTLLLEGPAAARGALAALVLVVAIVLARQAGRAFRGGPGPCRGSVLRVDQTGAPSVATEPGQAPMPAVLRASCGLPGLILLVLAPSAPQPGVPARSSTVTLLSGRDGLPDDDWRRLNVWLRWMERGRHTLPSS